MTTTEWREGWFWHRSYGCDWREWSLGFHIGFKAHRSIAADIGLGPLFWYGGFEWGQELFEDGQRAGMGIGPV